MFPINDLMSGVLINKDINAEIKFKFGLLDRGGYRFRDATNFDLLIKSANTK
jgi:hypothetical protein